MKLAYPQLETLARELGVLSDSEKGDKLTQAVRRLKLARRARERLSRVAADVTSAEKQFLAAWRSMTALGWSTVETWRDFESRTTLLRREILKRLEKTESEKNLVRAFRSATDADAVHQVFVMLAKQKGEIRKLLRLKNPGPFDDDDPVDVLFYRVQNAHERALHRLGRMKRSEGESWAAQAARTRSTLRRLVKVERGSAERKASALARVLRDSFDPNETGALEAAALEVQTLEQLQQRIENLGKSPRRADAT